MSIKGEGVQHPNKKTDRTGGKAMTESKNTYLPEQGEIDRTKIKGYSLRIGAFTSWVKENGYTTSQISVVQR